MRPRTPPPAAAQALMARFGLKPIPMAFRDARGTEVVALYHESGVLRLVEHALKLEKENADARRFLSAFTNDA